MSPGAVRLTLFFDPVPKLTAVPVIEVEHQPRLIQLFRQGSRLGVQTQCRVRIGFAEVPGAIFQHAQAQSVAITLLAGLLPDRIQPPFEVNEVHV